MVYRSNLIFIVMQVVGFGGIQYCMVRVALLMKKRFAAVLFVLSFIFILGTLILHKAGLAKLKD
ncbi:MAG: hypothetical protein IJ663_03960 [Spirochaetales bacterium]|nr:hypothetical protein [Spirochaetales bacterium]